MDEFTLKRAEKFMNSGMAAVSRGEVQVARDSFRASAHVLATAEALTFWGWMEHHLGNTQQAIELCKSAIEIDPDFGNPYNDIGSYLVSLGNLDEAVPWLEKAIKASRYEPRHYPHLNLGRIYFSKKSLLLALEHFKKAQEFVPENLEIHQMIEEINQSIN